MAIENFSDFFSEFSLGKILSGDFPDLVPFLYLAITIAIYSILIWHFYRFIARRDCFKLTTNKHVKLIGFLKYFFLYPFVAFLFFTGFSLMLFFITKEYEPGQILTTSFALIIAIRITAYYSEDLSKDVAKMLPFALLGVFIVQASYFEFDSIIDRIYEMPSLINQMIQLLFFIVLIEWVLRILLAIRYKISPKKEQVIESSS